MSSLASSQSQLLRGVSGANALGANTPAQARRVSTLVRAGKAPEEHVPSKAKSDDAPELEDTIANKVMSGVAAASIIANVAIAPVALAAGAIEELYGQHGSNLGAVIGPSCSDDAYNVTAKEQRALFLTGSEIAPEPSPASQRAPRWGPAPAPASQRAPR